MTKLAGTHYPGCYLHPEHHQCALTEIKRISELHNGLMAEADKRLDMAMEASCYNTDAAQIVQRLLDVARAGESLRSRVKERYPNFDTNELDSFLTLYREMRRDQVTDAMRQAAWTRYPNCDVPYTDIYLAMRAAFVARALGDAP